MGVPLPSLPTHPAARLALLHVGLYQLRDKLQLSGQADGDLARTAEQVRITCELEKDLLDPRILDILWFLQNLEPELLPMQNLPLPIRVTRQTLRGWADRSTEPTYAFNYTLGTCITLAAHQPDLPTWYLHSIINTGKDRWLLTALTLLEPLLPNRN